MAGLEARFLSRLSRNSGSTPDGARGGVTPGPHAGPEPRGPREEQEGGREGGGGCGVAPPYPPQTPPWDRATRPPAGAAGLPAPCTCAPHGRSPVVRAATRRWLPPAYLAPTPAPAPPQPRLPKEESAGSPGGFSRSKMATPCARTASAATARPVGGAEGGAGSRDCGGTWPGGRGRGPPEGRGGEGDPRVRAGEREPCWQEGRGGGRG